MARVTTNSTDVVRRLLILDDDPDVARVIASHATLSGFDVRLSESASEFLTAVDEWKPSHITLDLVMPDMDGVEVLRELSERSSTARIVLASGMGTRVLDAARRMGLERGLTIAGVLPKPFTRAQLIDLLTLSDVVETRVADVGPSDQHRMAEEAALRAALDRNEFVVVFQPKVSAAGLAIGYEALLRWNHPSEGMMAPAAFLPAIERSSLLDEVTYRVLELALDMADQAGLPEDESVAINLSALSLGDLHIADELAATCVRRSFSPDRLTVELTETGDAPNAMNALDIVTRLRMKGFAVAIDDFGTGFSSMRQLAQLPFSELKVDRSFVGTMCQSAESHSIVRATIDLAHNLDMGAVAEGVEDRETLELLFELECDMFQGYFIVPPLSLTGLVDWRSRWHGWSSVN